MKRLQTYQEYWIWCHLVCFGKINKNFIKYIKEKAKSTNGISSINPYIPIREQELSTEVETVLGMISNVYLKDEE